MELMFPRSQVTGDGNGSEELTFGCDSGRTSGATVMADKGKQEHFSQERQRESPEGAPYKKITGEPRPPIEDDDFARRAGEIIARAVGAVTDPRRRGK
jgi:hypothetical protein